MVLYEWEEDGDVQQAAPDVHARPISKADSRGWGLGGFVAYAAAESAGLFERDGWAM